MKNNIAIVMGGYSSEVEISLKSGRVVFQHLNRALYQPYQVHILKDKWILVDGDQSYPIQKDDFSAIIDGEKITFDCVFNAIHGDPGENGVFLAYLELLGIKHTSAPFYQMALTFNKRDTLSVLKSYGVKAAKSVYLNQGDTINTEAIIDKLGLPFFVKPNNAGSSFGISKVKNKEEVLPALEKAYKEDSEVLIEEFLDGTEVSIGVIEFEGKIKVLPPTEIISENDFFDYEAKYEGKSSEITPARLTPIRLSNLNKVAKEIYKILNMSGYSRSEYIFIGDDPYFIEMNSVPGLTNESLLPLQAKEAGMSLETLFGSAIESSLSK